MSHASSFRVHADRAAGRDRHHRHPDRPAAARRAEGPRGRRPDASARTTSSRSAWRCHNYHDANKAFPLGNWKPNNFSAHSQLLPYIEQTALYQQINFTVPYNNAANTAATALPVSVFLCPADPQSFVPAGWGGNNYVGNYGSTIKWGQNGSVANGVFWHDTNTTGLGCRFGDISDGTSNTAAFSERRKGDWSNSAVDHVFGPRQPGGQPVHAGRRDEPLPVGLRRRRSGTRTSARNGSRGSRT